jgi:hypothetical protein
MMANLMAPPGPTPPPRHPDSRSAKLFLEELQVSPGNVFVLGSFNRYITVHSQQTRAANLIHALVNTSGSLAGKKSLWSVAVSLA